MSGDSSEEKSLPPSAKKLRDARKRGQLARAPEMVTALAMLGMVGYVWGGADWIEGRLREALLATEAATAMPFAEALGQVAPRLMVIAASVVGPVLAIAVLVSVAATVLTNGGVVLSLDPLMPKLEHIDPFKGFGRLYSVRSWVELGKSLVKAALFGGVLAVLAVQAVNPLVRAPSCGIGCLPVLLGAVLKPLLAAAGGIMLAAGLADLLLQRWLFVREMRMTQTEAKRERKDQDGSREVKGAQDRIRREDASGPRLGLAAATLLIGGDGASVGVRYVRGETDVPVVVCRARGERAAPLLAAARAADIKVLWDDRLASGLAAKLRPGAKVPAALFGQVAQALYASGAIR